MKRLIALIFLIPLLWFMGFKPLMADCEFKRHYLLGQRSNNLKGEERKETYKKAVDALNKAIRLNSDNSLYLVAAYSITSTQRRYEKADRFLNRIIDTHNGDLRPWKYYQYKSENDARMGNQYLANYYIQKALAYDPHYIKKNERLHKNKR